MYYFAYGHDLNWRSVAEWCDRHGVRANLPRVEARAAVLQNYRIAFAQYDEYWNGGVADVVPEPGKSVAGGLISIAPRTLELLEQLHNRVLDFNGREIGRSQLIDVNVNPYRGGERISAVTFRRSSFEDGHVPPTSQYIDRMVEAALDLDLSAMWVMQLRSFVSWTVQSTEIAVPAARGLTARNAVPPTPTVTAGPLVSPVDVKV